MNRRNQVKEDNAYQPKNDINALVPQCDSVFKTEYEKLNQIFNLVEIRQKMEKLRNGG